MTHALKPPFLGDASNHTPAPSQPPINTAFGSLVPDDASGLVIAKPVSAPSRRSVLISEM